MVAVAVTVPIGSVVCGGADVYAFDVVEGEVVFAEAISDVAGIVSDEEVIAVDDTVSSDCVGGSSFVSTGGITHIPAIKRMNDSNAQAAPMKPNDFLLFFIIHLITNAIIRPTQANASERLTITNNPPRNSILIYTSFCLC